MFSIKRTIFMTTVYIFFIFFVFIFNIYFKLFYRNVLVPIMIAVLISFLGVAVTVVAVLICKRKNWKFSKGNIFRGHSNNRYTIVNARNHTTCNYCHCIEIGWEDHFIFI